MGLIDALPMGGRHHLKVQDSVTKAGQNEICAYLSPLGVDLRPNTPEWAWAWEVTEKKTYTGTLPKRIAKWANKNCQVKLDKDQLSKIGQLASLHRMNGEEYWFMFNDKLDWGSGDFGDTHACWFKKIDRMEQSSKSHEALLKCGWIGMCFYEDGEFNQGVGRCLFLPCGDYAIVMNGFWRDLYASVELTIKMAGVLAAWLGTDYKRIALYRDAYAGLIYPNGDGAAVGPKEIIAPINRIETTDKPRKLKA
jgi:hypothetical protein